MSIERADGINESERYLQRLCEQTFLSLWSYPGVYSDEGLNRNKQGKEVCDLLVIFENHIIIFSDKDCQFPNSGDLTVDWNRWFKKSIKKSVKQLWGAEKWIKKHSDRLFLDNLCSQRFPLYIPEINEAKIHLVAVAHNSSERCRKEFGGSGNLKIEISSETSNHSTQNPVTSPFCVGDIDPNKTFVHILDDLSLDAVLSTLDTIADLVAYLAKKEILFRSGCHVSSANELEILAYYHQFINDDDERDFLVPTSSNGEKSELILSEGSWQEFENSPGRRAKLEEDRISYRWDALIERVSYYSLKGNLHHTSHSAVAEQEILLRVLASENRFHRRILANALCDLIDSAPIDGTVTVRYVPIFSPHGPHFSRPKICYIFMVMPHFEWMTYEEYRSNRSKALELRFPIAKLRFPETQYVVGLATETIVLGKEGRSEDFIHVDVTEWTSEDERRAKNIEKEFKLSEDLSSFRYHYDEYPN